MHARAPEHLAERRTAPTLCGSGHSGQQHPTIGAPARRARPPRGAGVLHRPQSSGLTSSTAPMMHRSPDRSHVELRGSTISGVMPPGGDRLFQRSRRSSSPFRRNRSRSGFCRRGVAHRMQTEKPQCFAAAALRLRFLVRSPSWVFSSALRALSCALSAHHAAGRRGCNGCWARGLDVPLTLCGL